MNIYFRKIASNLLFFIKVHLAHNVTLEKSQFKELFKSIETPVLTHIQIGFCCPGVHFYGFKTEHLFR